MPEAKTGGKAQRARHDDELPIAANLREVETAEHRATQADEKRPTILARRLLCG
jgi:hypothetical protein